MMDKGGYVRYKATYLHGKDKPVVMAAKGSMIFTLIARDNGYGAFSVAGEWTPAILANGLMHAYDESPVLVGKALEMLTAYVAGKLESQKHDE